MTFRSDATEGVWTPTQNVAVQTEANVVAIFFFHQCGFYDPTHHIRGCQKINRNFALKGRALIRRGRARVDMRAPRARGARHVARGSRVFYYYYYYSHLVIKVKYYGPFYNLDSVIF